MDVLGLCPEVVHYYIDIDSDKSIETHIPNSGVTSLKEKPSLTTEINLAPWNKLYRTSFLKETKNCFVVELKYEDAPFVLKAIKDDKKIDFCSKCLIHYVLGKKGETLTRDVRIFDIFKICLIIENIFIDYDCTYRTDLTVKILSYYLKSSRYIKDKRLRNKFIDTYFEYLDSLNKNWRRSSYLKKMNPIKKLIFTNRQALKLFGNLKNI